jgi:hypothetical protein
LKETVMDTSKLIEVGKVSEETKGEHETMELPGELTRGPPEA